MRFGVIGRDGDSLRDEIDGGVVLPHLMGDHAKQMKRDGLIGVGLQDPSIDAFSLGQAARGVVAQSEVHGVLDGWRVLPEGTNRGLSRLCAADRLIG